VKHPSELDLAALATGDMNFFRRFGLDRHVNGCEQCQAEIAAFREMRSELAGTEMPELNWDALASEMCANIHLGLEAGECVRVTPESKFFSPRLAGAFASLLLLAGAGFFMRDHRPRPQTAAEATAPPVTPTPEYRMPVLETSMDGIQLRTGPTSFALLNREGGDASQTVSAQGAVRSRDIDAGSVTIKDVYLQ
jgi:hypothetical protein